MTDKYLKGIPNDSRAGKEGTFLKKEHVTEEIVDKAHKLNQIAYKRGQSLSQMALSWCLRDDRVTSVLIGASSPAHIIENVGAVKNTNFTEDEIAAIDLILK